MRALMVEADWEPRRGFDPTPKDAERHLARNGNLVWKNPRFQRTRAFRLLISPSPPWVRTRS